jgi:hypothetical protein
MLSTKSRGHYSHSWSIIISVWGWSRAIMFRCPSAPRFAFGFCPSVLHCLRCCCHLIVSFNVSSRPCLCQWRWLTPASIWGSGALQNTSENLGRLIKFFFSESWKCNEGSANNCPRAIVTNVIDHGDGGHPRRRSNEAFSMWVVHLSATLWGLRPRSPTSHLLMVKSNGGYTNT